MVRIPCGLGMKRAMDVLWWGDGGLWGGRPPQKLSVAGDGRFVSAVKLCSSLNCLLSSDVLTPHYPWQTTDMSVGILPPHHGNDFGLDPPGHNKENEDDVEAMSTDSSSSSSDSD